MTERFTCPRRVEVGMDSARGPFNGTGTGLDTWAHGHGLATQGRGCSYCGSMNPEDFLDIVREGGTVDPTDKNYKAYIHGRDEEGKFYFQHLNDEQKNEFIALYNEGRMNLGFPGYFYRMPFFATKEPREHDTDAPTD